MPQGAKERERERERPCVESNGKRAAALWCGKNTNSHFAGQRKPADLCLWSYGLINQIVQRQHQFIDVTDITLEGIN